MTTLDLKKLGDDAPVENINPKDPPPEPMPGLVDYSYSAKMSVTAAPQVEAEDGGDTTSG